jgi:hypothetical protein
MPGSSRRKTFRISSSSKTIDVFDCSAPTGRASRELDHALGPLQRQPAAHRTDELARELRVLEAVDLELAVTHRVQQLVDVVRAGVVSHLDECERELRLGRSQHDRLHELRVRDGT